jgi:hypothetical protein
VMFLQSVAITYWCNAVGKPIRPHDWPHISPSLMT